MTRQAHDRCRGVVRTRSDVIVACHPLTGRVAAGESLLSPTVTRRLIAEFTARTRTPQARPGLDDLTAREREVVTLIATGLSIDEIARQLNVSASTVKTHAGRAMMKLAARDRAQLVVAAYETGLVLPGQ